MVDFSKHKHGDVVVVHCCDECARKAGVNPKRPADSGKASWLCDVCGHHGIGSLTDCEIGDWLRLRPLQPNALATAHETIEAMQQVEPMNAVAIEYAHRLALELECVLADRNTNWDRAMNLIGEYRSAMNAIHEQHSPTHMGEPVLGAAIGGAK
jgi:hypothetical protein